jgi:hypothetical protein
MTTIGALPTVRFEASNRQLLSGADGHGGGWERPALVASRRQIRIVGTAACGPSHFVTCRSGSSAKATIQ